jgi:hypothetical protein
MLRSLGITLRIKAGTAEVLSALTANLERHRGLVAEANAGYLKAAAVALEERLGVIRSGKVTSLHFTSLRVPKDYSEVYQTAIGMLKAHTEQTVELDADVYRHLMEDQWDWFQEWVTSNAAYSAGTRAYGASKGVRED